jgi:DNA-binding MarR family transcriptional regulator
MASLKSNETTVEDLKLTLGLLVRRMRAAAPSESRDLSWTQKSVLVRLEKEGPATISELARAEVVKPQSMGTAIAALEGMGMVERKADPTDGRQMNIKLTDKGSLIRRTTRDSSLASGVTLSTLRRASDLDFRCIVLKDACFDADPEVHRVLTEKIFPMQATVLTVDAFIAQQE